MLDQDSSEPMSLPVLVARLLEVAECLNGRCRTDEIHRDGYEVMSVGTRIEGEDGTTYLQMLTFPSTPWDQGLERHDDGSSQDAEAVKTKLGVRQVNFNNLSEADIKPSDKVGAAFWCLGTTRKYDGSAEAFRKGRAAIQADIWKKVALATGCEVR
ncbi:hypothetical protein PC110_g18038 [Phytophthora cactorum]|uniref:Uncharacterized protein n=1 Tax=Phytophthora cactorum TaxID=29920 RepID=A0A329RQ95_9STRA|nr:hypothetical protein PC110_g18038 [Phytophthora cactorum]